MNIEVSKTKIERRKNSERRKLYTAPALSKGLDILELLSSESRGLTLRKIAEKLNRSKGEIFRMLVVLEQRAYVSMDRETEKYSLSLKIFELAHHHPRTMRLTNVAGPYIAELAKNTKQSCHLIIYYNAHGLVIAQQDSPSDRRFGVRLGSQVTLNSCSGHLILAYADDELRAEILKQQSTKTKQEFTKSALTKIINRIHKQGYETVESNQISGVKDVGYPIFDFSGKMVAALVIPFLEHLDNSNAVDFNDTQDMLDQTAASLSIELGQIEPIKQSNLYIKQ